jgi:hypothetical protein
MQFVEEMRDIARDQEWNMIIGMIKELFEMVSTVDFDSDEEFITK